jgi:hypothetical protein
VIANAAASVPMERIAFMIARPFLRSLEEALRMCAGPMPENLTFLRDGKGEFGPRLSQI